jgi:hypothetical protein
VVVRKSDHCVVGLVSLLQLKAAATTRVRRMMTTAGRGEEREGGRE